MVPRKRKTKNLFGFQYFILTILAFTLFYPNRLIAQNKNQDLLPEKKNDISKVWNPDLGNGKYKNPVIFAIS